MSMTLTSILSEALKKYHCFPAIKADGLAWTYKELDDISNSFASFLITSGIQLNDKIVSLTGNSAWSVVSLLAILKSGGTEVALQPTEPFEKIISIVAEISPRIIIVTDNEYKDQLVKYGVNSDKIIIAADSWQEVINVDNNCFPTQSSTDIALIQYTSGSTGKPKGVMLTNEAICTVLSNSKHFSDIERRKLCLGIPLAHAYGKTSLIEYLICGSCIFVENGFILPIQITHIVGSKEIQCLEGPPTMYEMACKDDNFNGLKLPYLKYIAMNSSKPRLELLSALRARFPESKIVIRYGITEIAGPLCRLVWNPGEKVPLDSCGIPEDYVSIELVDDAGLPISNGEKGEVVISSPGAMYGYFGDESLENKPYSTGDIGHFDDEGYLYLDGRKNFMIKSGGHRIFPGEIETIVRSIHGVDDCAAGGVPDDHYGEKVVLWIVSNSDDNCETLKQDIIRMCRGQLLSIWWPQDIIFMKQLPKTVSNKIRLSVLISDYQSKKLPAMARETVNTDKSYDSEKKKVTLYDNTLRDGEQTVGVNFSPADKVKIAEQLIRTGITQFEAGFAAVSEQERLSLQSITSKFNSTGCRIFSLSRLHKNDVTCAYDAGVRNLTIFVPSSDVMIKARLNKSIDDIKYDISSVVGYAKSKNIRVKFSCEDATRSSLERLVEFYKIAEEAGADAISVPDTVGSAMPVHYGNLIRDLRKEISLPISAHCHNDFGLAVANSIAAYNSGADEIQVTVNGLGERVGNTSMEEFILAMKVGYGINFDIDLIEMNKLSGLVSSLSNIEIPASKPIVGRNAFLHESGIHVQGLLRQDLPTYEPFPPEWVGRKHEVAFGKHSGKSNVRFLCRQYGIVIAEDVENIVLREIKKRSQESKTNLNIGDVLAIILTAQKEHVSLNMECEL